LRGEGVAGKKQHHVWQFIQRGFGELEYGDHHLWVFEKGVSPRKTATKKYGFEDYFYGEENSAADKNITVFEARNVEYLRSARKSANLVQLDSNLIAPVISHFEMRSAFLRFELSRVIERIVENLKIQMRDPQFLLKHVDNYLRNKPEILANEINKLGESSSMNAALSELAYSRLPYLLEQRVDGIPGGTDGLFEPLLPLIAKMAKEAHIKSLEGSFSEIERTKNHAKQSYFVLQYPKEQPLILPDTGIAFATKSTIRPISFKDDQVDFTLLPISSETLIVGCKKAWSHRSYETIISILASCSYKSFVAKHQTKSINGVANKIGRCALLMQDHEIDRMVEKIDP
jgi:hypothetical protein